jgi:hypothetical protein
MFKRLTRRWRQWNSPKSRQLRKLQRSLAWLDAAEEAEARRGEKRKDKAAGD